MAPGEASSGSACRRRCGRWRWRRGCWSARRGRCPAMVDVGQRRDLDLGVEVPEDELGAVCTNEQWGELYDRIAALAREHKSTLVFVNTRRLVERVTLHLGERLGADTVAAHHGSLSRERRHHAERRLKAGDLESSSRPPRWSWASTSAPSSLTCLIGSPRSIATGLQRIGRSGHALRRARPRGASSRSRAISWSSARRWCAPRGARRSTPSACATRRSTCWRSRSSPPAPARSGTRTRSSSSCRRAAPYAELARERLRRASSTCSPRASPPAAGARARCSTATRSTGRLRGRRGARLAALTSGGAIPDNANYDVVLEPEGTLIGTIDEDFAIESMAGDIILLGNTSWRIRRVEPGQGARRGRGRRAADDPVLAGRGAGAHARAVGRGRGAARGDRRRRTRAARIRRRRSMARARSTARGAELLRDYVRGRRGRARRRADADARHRRALLRRGGRHAAGHPRAVRRPHQPRLGHGAAQALLPVVRLRAPGRGDRRRHRAVARPAAQLPARDGVLDAARRRTSRSCSTQAALQAPMFETRWRWNATRSLALLRSRGGRARPAGAPAHARAGSDRRGLPGADGLPGQPRRRRRSRSPTTRWCARRCATAWSRRWTPPGLRARAGGARATAASQTTARELPEPSVFAHEILNANPYAFLDDAPLEERRTRAVSVRRGLPAAVVERIGGARSRRRSTAVVAEAQPDARDADELHDLLLDVGALPEAIGRERDWTDAVRGAGGRPRGPPASTATPRPLGRGRAPLAGGGGLARPPLRPGRASSRRRAGRAPGPTARRARRDRARPPRASRVRRRRTRSRRGSASRASDVEAALARLEMEGAVLRGRFRDWSSWATAIAVVRSAPARAHQPPHARRPPPRDRAGQRRRLPALPVRLAARPPGQRSSTASRAWRA